jgi:hypothetical protein
MRAALLAVSVALAPLSGAWAQEEVPSPAPVETVAVQPAPADTLSIALPVPMPPPSRERPPETTDEGGLWGVSDRAEQEARVSGTLERDAALTEYVRGVGCRVAAQYCGDVRLYVMNRPFFNASMAPNGYMEVWSGLLLRADDEAQLAFVLGHETTHYAEHHSLDMLRTIRGRATLAMILSVGAAVAGAGYVGDLIYLGTLASVFGYSREKEEEADRIGFQHAVAAGYDANAGATIWTNLIGETQVSDNPDVRRRETRASVFATHPVSRERVADLQRYAREHGGIGETQRERYRAAIRPHLDPWLRAELRRRDFGQTLHLLDRLGSHGDDLGVVEFYRGEVYRLRRGEGDRALARQHYTAAMTHADAPAGAWRELGDIEQRDGNTDAARTLYTTYLERAPNAEDRALVESRLAQLGGAP